MREERRGEEEEDEEEGSRGSGCKRQRVRSNRKSCECVYEEVIQSGGSSSLFSPQTQSHLMKKK